MNYPYLDGNYGITTRINAVYNDTPTTIDEIVVGTVKLDRALCNAEQLEIGGCIASKLEFDTYGEVLTRLDTLALLQDLSNEERIITIPVFKGFVDSLETSEDGITHIIAYDFLAKSIDVSNWYNDLYADADSVAIDVLMNGVLTQLGISYSRVNYNILPDSIRTLQLPKTMSGNIDGVQLLKWLCEIMGVFGFIDVWGDFEIKYLDTNIENLTVMSNFKHSNFSCQKIDKVQIRAESDDIGSIVGAGTNALIIQGNPLTFGLDADTLHTIADNIYEHYKDVEYTPFEAELPVGVPILDLGKAYNLITDEYALITIPLSTSCGGSQLVDQTISANGVEVRNEVVTDVNSEVITNAYNTLKVLKTVNSFDVRIERAEDNSSQALAEVELKIDKTDNDQIVSMLNASADEIHLKSNRLIIDSDNFKLTQDGRMTCEWGEIGGINIGASVIKKSISDIIGTVTPTERGTYIVSKDAYIEFDTTGYSEISLVIEASNRAEFTLQCDDYDKDGKHSPISMQETFYAEIGPREAIVTTVKPLPKLKEYPIKRLTFLDNVELQSIGIASDKKSALLYNCTDSNVERIDANKNAFYLGADGVAIDSDKFKLDADGQIKVVSGIYKDKLGVMNSDGTVLKYFKIITDDYSSPTIYKYNEKNKTIDASSYSLHNEPYFSLRNNNDALYDILRLSELLANAVYTANIYANNMSANTYVGDKAYFNDINAINDVKSGNVSLTTLNGKVYTTDTQAMVRSDTTSTSTRAYLRGRLASNNPTIDYQNAIEGTIANRVALIYNGSTFNVEGKKGTNEASKTLTTEDYFTVQEITSGTVTAGNTVTNITVDFAREYKNVPQVLATVESNTSYPERVLYISRVTATKTGCTIALGSSGYASDIELSNTRKVKLLIIGY